jgi:hypothetical protein
LKKVWCKAIIIFLCLAIRPCSSSGFGTRGKGFIEQIDDESFIDKKNTGDVDLSLLQGVILNPEHAPTVKGIGMRHNTKEGLFRPTNQENAKGAPKFQCCCREEDKICRPEFASKAENRPVLDKGRLSSVARKLLPKEVRNCRPKDFFDTQILPGFVKRCIVNTSNARAAAEGRDKKLNSGVRVR